MSKWAIGMSPIDWSFLAYVRNALGNCSQLGVSTSDSTKLYSTRGARKAKKAPKLQMNTEKMRILFDHTLPLIQALANLGSVGQGSN